jgi:hypothetical protein
MLGYFKRSIGWQVLCLSVACHVIDVPEERFRLPPAPAVTDTRESQMSDSIRLINIYNYAMIPLSISVSRNNALRFQDPSPLLSLQVRFLQLPLQFLILEIQLVPPTLASLQIRFHGVESLCLGQAGIVVHPIKLGVECLDCISSCTLVRSRLLEDSPRRRRQFRQ